MHVSVVPKCLGVLWWFHSTCPRLGGPRNIWDWMHTKIMQNDMITYWYELLLHPWTPHIVAQQAVIGDCYNISCNIFSPRLRPPWTQLPNLQRKNDETLWGGLRGQVHHWILFGKLKTWKILRYVHVRERGKHYMEDDTYFSHVVE